MSKESIGYFLVVEIKFVDNPKFNVSIEDIDLIDDGEDPHIKTLKDILLVTDTEEKAQLAVYAAFNATNGEKLYEVREVSHFF